MKILELGRLRDINEGVYKSTVRAFKNFNIHDKTEVVLHVRSVTKLEQVIDQGHTSSKEPFEYQDISEIIITYHYGRDSYSAGFIVKTKDLMV